MQLWTCKADQLHSIFCRSATLYFCTPATLYFSRSAIHCSSCRSATLYFCRSATLYFCRSAIHCIFADQLHCIFCRPAIHCIFADQLHCIFVDQPHCIFQLYFFNAQPEARFELGGHLHCRRSTADTSAESHVVLPS